MENALAFAQTTADGFKKKADHNKTESLSWFTAILICTIATPLFITLGKIDFLSKVVPSVLSAIAAIGTSWLQLRKPQKLWSMYRESQRLIEDQVTKYRFEIEDYQDKGEADRLLAGKVAEIALSAHYEWTAVIPTPEFLSIKETSHGK